MKKAVFFATGVLFFSALPLAAQTTVPTTAELLEGYLSADTELQALEVRLEKARLASKRTGVANGASLSAGTGTMVLRKEGVALEPFLKVELPMLRGLTAGVTGTVNTASPEGASLSRVEAALPVVTRSPKRRKAARLRAERSVSEAETAVERRALLAEKAFWGELQELYTLQVNMLTTRNTAYDKDLTVRGLQAQGFSSAATRMRTALLEAADAHRTEREQERLLERRTASFSRKCAVPPLTVLPEMKAPFVLGTVNVAVGREVEAARWAHSIGELERAGSGGAELSLTGRYTPRSQTLGGADSAMAGLALTWGGVTLSGGTELDLAGKRDPALNLSLTFQSSDARVVPIDKAEKRLDSRSEILAIRAAEEAWEETLKSREEEGRDLLWERGQRAEQKALYDQLRAEMSASFQRGDISESEWRKAEADAEKARVQCLVTEVKILVYIIEGKLL